MRSTNSGTLPPRIVLRTTLDPTDDGQHPHEQEQRHVLEGALGQGPNPTITLDERLENGRKVVTIAILEQRNRDIVLMPAKAGIVEVDHMQSRTVDDDVVRVQVSVNQTVGAVPLP